MDMNASTASDVSEAAACGDGFEPLEPDLDFVAIRIGDVGEWTRLMRDSARSSATFRY